VHAVCTGGAVVPGVDPAGCDEPVVAEEPDAVVDGKEPVGPVAFPPFPLPLVPEHAATSNSTSSPDATAAFLDPVSRRIAR